MALLLLLLPIGLGVSLPLASFILLLFSPPTIALIPPINATATTTITKGTNITKPGCPEKCGSLTVPYPFGVGSGCALDPSMEINCNTTSRNDTNPLIGNIGVYHISDSQVWISNDVVYQCYNRKGAVTSQNWASTTWTDFSNYNPYTFSHENKFTVVGCDDDATLARDNLGKMKRTAQVCSASCDKPEDVIGGSCEGTNGCCQYTIPKGSKYYNILSLESPSNHTQVWSGNPCGYAFIGETGKFNFRGFDDLKDPNFIQRVMETVPIVLDWAIGILRCKVANNSDDYACKEKSQCVDVEAESGGYRCRCEDGYEGNPYISHGCQDIDECTDPYHEHQCEMNCTNTPGSYTCSCPDGYQIVGDGKKRINGGVGCLPPVPPKKSDFPRWIKFACGLGISFLSLVAGLTWLYFFKKRLVIRLRKKFFQQNGGLILNQRIITIADGVGVDAAKIFTAEELKRATNDYSSDRELGRGGNGIVYKGIMSDNRVVAIKKSKTMDKRQIEEFINEVIILTQVNHRNVVKLIGCCLEVKVPILVYEYVSHGTLYEHIHTHGGGSDWLSWETRLRIAAETAGALAYLHSSAAIPIFHRDVKSTNILIDGNYVTKVSDFGASRLIPLDQTHKATLVQGTFGYLDPEYFRTGQLTEKSDVYSFGVVICELLTGMKPVSRETSEWRNLAAYVVISMDKNQLLNILDQRVLQEAVLEQVERVAELAVRCLQLNGKDRPTMKEVAMELERLRNFNKNQHGDDDVIVVGQMDDEDVSSSASDL